MKVLGFTSVVKNDNYVYGNYLNNRAAIKCVPLARTSFLYLAVAGSDRNIVEKLRNDISKKMSIASSGEISNKFVTFSVSEISMFFKGYQLFLSGNFSGKFKDGFYTDPNKETSVYDFWSNGKWAKYDRNGDGYHETIFEVVSSKLKYVGSLGREGKFIHVGEGYKRFLKKPASAWDDYIKSFENKDSPKNVRRI